MIPKCSLDGYNSYLQILALLFMIIILVIVVSYYLQATQCNIMEKYQDQVGNLDTSTIEYKTETDAGNRSTYPQDKYPGAKMDLLVDNATADTSTGDVYGLRDCKVYFTDDIKNCDDQGESSTKTCSYKFDGWQEFDTYQDNNGNTLTYPKKIYKPNASNTSELINSHFTSKCFKEFSNNGRGGAKRFEFKENTLVKYDSKGIGDNTQIDTNVFGGKKYTSIQFMNSDDAGDNLTKVIDSICSIKYKPIRDLTGKTFYKFNFDNSLNIRSIEKLALNEDQSGFIRVNNSAIDDFASLGSHGLRFNDSGQLQIFINDAAINSKMNIYKFTYVTNLCEFAQIKNYTKYPSKDINITNFVSFEVDAGKSKEKIITDTTINNNLYLIESSFKARWKIKNGNININYNKEILEYLEGKQQEVIKGLKDSSETTKTGYRINISNFQRDITRAETRRNEFKGRGNTFTNIIDLNRIVRINNVATEEKIFKYGKGYINNLLNNIPIPTGVEASFVNSTDICLIFKNKEWIDQKSYSFTVPSGLSYTCDILVVGGGGGGTGTLGGGGGAGAVVHITGASLSSGTYNIGVGRGGAGNHFNSENGKQSIITGTPRNIIAEGGGGTSGPHDWGDGNRGGSGGGAAAPNSQLNYGGPAGTGSSLGGFNGRIYANRGGNITDRRYWNRTNSSGGGGAGSPAPDINPSQDWAGKGGDGISLNITGNNVFYGGGGGGSAHIAWGGVGGRGGGGVGGRENSRGSGGERDTGSGGGGGGWWGNLGGNGGSGIIIIRIKNIITIPAITYPGTDDYYKVDPIATIAIPSSRIQTNMITSFVYLQKGFYRFRADIGVSNEPNPNILYAELVIYNENNRSGGNSIYNCKKVFKYNLYNNKYRPSYLKQYVEIPQNRFYKLAYTYYYINNTSTNIDTNFQLYSSYLDTAPQNLEGSLPSGVIAWYRFDNSIADINPSTTKYNFSYWGTPIYPNETFQGRRFINIRSCWLWTPLDLSRRSFSISTWIRTKSASGGFPVLRGEAHGTNLYLHIGMRDNNGYSLAFYGNDLECGVGTGTQSRYPEDINNWVHIVYVVEQNFNRKVYRNGKLISRDNNTQALVAWGNFRLWAHDMDISDFIIFNRAVNENEVETLYNDPPSINEAILKTTSTQLTDTSNDDTLFTRNYLNKINTSLNQYLFSGTRVHADYSNNNMIRIFSTISYQTNSDAKVNSLNYQALTDYIDKGSIDNQPIDYFEIVSLNQKINAQQILLDAEYGVLTDKINMDPTIAGYKTLYNKIRDINYKVELPLKRLTLITGRPFVSIFGQNGSGEDKVTNYITFDKVFNLNNLGNANLSKAVYIEALN